MPEDQQKQFGQCGFYRYSLPMNDAEGTNLVFVALNTNLYYKNNNTGDIEQFLAFDDDIHQHHHHHQRDRERERETEAVFDQRDKRERGQKHHRALREVENARGLVDQHEAERHQRIEHAGHQAANQSF